MKIHLPLNLFNYCQEKISKSYIIWANTLTRAQKQNRKYLGFFLLNITLDYIYNFYFIIQINTLLSRRLILDCD